MKTFHFFTNSIPIFNALIAILNTHGYDINLLATVYDQTIKGGITVGGYRNGRLWISSSLSGGSFTRLDDLIIFLTSIDTDSESKGSYAILKLDAAPEDGITREEFNALLTEVPLLKTYLELQKNS